MKPNSKKNFGDTLLGYCILIFFVIGFLPSIITFFPFIIFAIAKGDSEVSSIGAVSLIGLVVSLLAGGIYKIFSWVYDMDREEPK